MIRHVYTCVGMATVESITTELTVEEARKSYVAFDSNPSLRRLTRHVATSSVTYTWTNRPADSRNPKGVGTTHRLIIPRELCLDVPEHI